MSKEKQNKPVEKKKFDIPEEIIKQATLCKNKFSCLEDPLVLEEVRFCLDCKTIFVKNTKTNPCLYKKEYGNTYRCFCPVRQELYNKYKV
ncbi:MAG: hypothetical protein HY810_08095 [Candidatus Omnitrophica bacterium]|nr:hypothetical protein [Candidatus Omnitrophota bacterium]